MRTREPDTSWETHTVFASWAVPNKIFPRLSHPVAIAAAVKCFRTVDD